MGILDGWKPGRSGGGYIDEGRAAIAFALSAFGPVGILAGRAFGDVFSDKALPFPLPLRDPIGGGIAPGDASRGMSLGT
jgi:hypothetical protein